MDRVSGKVTTNDNNLDASSALSSGSGSTDPEIKKEEGQQLELQVSQKLNLADQVNIDMNPPIEADFDRLHLDESSSIKSNQEPERSASTGSNDDGVKRIADLNENTTNKDHQIPNNEIPNLPTLSSHHKIIPLGVVVSIDGRQVTVEGDDQHQPLDEGSMLWINESIKPLGSVDAIFGPIFKNPYYTVRYENEDKIPSGVSVGTQVFYVQDFINPLGNDDRVSERKYYDDTEESNEELLGGGISAEEIDSDNRDVMASYERLDTQHLPATEENNEELAREGISNDEVKAEHSRVMNIYTSQTLQHLPGIETPDNHDYQYFWRRQDVQSSPRMDAHFQHILHPTSFDTGSGVYLSGMEIQQPQAMYSSNSFPPNRPRENSLLRIEGPEMPSVFQHQNSLVRAPGSGMEPVILRISHPTSNVTVVDVFWPNGVDIQQLQSPMYFPDALPHWMHPNNLFRAGGPWMPTLPVFQQSSPQTMPNETGMLPPLYYPTYGMQLMQQNIFIQTTYNMLTPTPPRMPLQHQLVPTQVQPLRDRFNVEHVLVSGNRASELPVPVVFDQTSDNRSTTTCITTTPYNMLTPTPPRIPLQQQLVPTQAQPPRYRFNVGEHVLVSGSSTSELPVPVVFDRTSDNQSTAMLMTTTTPDAFLANVPSSAEQNRAMHLPLMRPDNTYSGHQVHPFARPNIQLRGHIGRGAGILGRGGHFGRSAGILGRGGHIDRGAGILGRGGHFGRGAGILGRGDHFDRGAGILGRGNQSGRGAGILGRGSQSGRGAGILGRGGHSGSGVDFGDRGNHFGRGAGFRDRDDHSGRGAGFGG